MRLLAFCIVDMLNMDLNLLHCRYAEHGFELEIIALLILTRILEIHFATQNGAPSLPSPEALPFAVLFPSPSVRPPSFAHCLVRNSGGSSLLRWMGHQAESPTLTWDRKLHMAPMFLT